MERLILSGGGSGEQTREIDETFAKMLDKSKPLLYIPIAMDENIHPYAECLDWLKLTFDKFGVNKYEMWVEKDLQKFKKINIKDFGGVYIGGGNTPYLLKTLKESPAWVFLKNAIGKIPIYGGSAGAIIFAKTIIPSLCEDENEVGLKNFFAMNKLGDYELWCHYSKNEEKWIKQFTERYNLKKMILLPEETGLIVSLRTAEIIGKKGAFLVKDNKRLGLNIGDNFLLE